MLANIGITEAAAEPKERAAFSDLPPRQRVFLLVYFACFNATQAYRQAYNPKASEDVAAAAGSRLLSKGKVREYLDAYKGEAFHLARQTFLRAMHEATIPIIRRDRHGNPVKVGERPDWRVRLRAAEDLAELHNLFPKLLRRPAAA